MLGLVGLLGALFAGVMVDSLTNVVDTSDATEDPPGDGSSEDDLGSVDLLDASSAMAVGDASAETRDTSEDGTVASNDTVPPPPEDLWLTGSDLDDMLQGQAGDDTLEGGSGDDALNGGLGADSLSGGDGDDVLIGHDETDHLAGDAGADTLQGGEGNDDLHGNSGADSLVGGDGDDSLAGGADNDALDGGFGHDLLHGGAGSDTVDGGAGNDTLSGQDDSSDHALDFVNGGAGDDSLQLGAGDYGNGGEGADNFGLLDIQAGDPPMQITDYNPSEDALIVLYDPAQHPDPQLSLQTTSAGTTLLLDGVALANLADIAGLDLGSITLQAA